MLTLLKMTNEKTGNGSYKYVVRCDCGTEKIVAYHCMANNRTQSCGCLQKRTGKDAPAYKHGRSQTKEYDLEFHMKKNYGLTFEGYEEMLRKQNGVCKICLSPPPKQRKKRLSVDHCHKTGRVRGLLCDSCNRGLGLFKDNPDLMLNAISYLAR